MNKLINFTYIKLTITSLILLTSAVQAHTHNHVISEKTLRISEGIFDDNEVKDRPLSDWQGTWQSLNDYLIAGDLDLVILAKAKKDPTKNFANYKQYYQKGYATDVLFIGIEGEQIDFHKKESEVSCKYHYDGYKILHYTAGNKGVRYLFSCQEKGSNAPKYVQLSDHIIEATPSAHFHIYMGNESHEKLLTEMDNWPTYYPLSQNKNDIISEMLHH
ncbi:ZinT/AdcA family metal-binding protein [Orbus wheelerorum]|uniref:ZinT/AdcA family metal-binding protein n=1 Tax=Orbus wheelerorum TaxID=3074111 RepID=UPI00370D1E2D